jgi:hypothetical protein
MTPCRKSVVRDERAGPIVTSHKPFSAWREIFHGAGAGAAMIDRLVHHLFQHPGPFSPPQPALLTWRRAA